MQERSETRLSNAETSTIYLRCLNFSFFLFFIYFRSYFHLFFVCFFLFFASLLDRINQKKISTLLTVQSVFFRDLLFDEMFRQAVTACDRIKHSIDKYKNVFDENTRFSVYTRYCEV